MQNNEQRYQPATVEVIGGHAGLVIFKEVEKEKEHEGIDHELLHPPGWKKAVKQKREEKELHQHIEIIEQVIWFMQNRPQVKPSALYQQHQQEIGNEEPPVGETPF